MAIHTLYRAQAFGPGSTLWVIADEKANPIHDRMNWYLNFQILKAKAHKAESWAPQLRSILKENNITQFQRDELGSAPLMVTADKGFPVNNIVEVPLNINRENWVNNVHTIWEKLGQPNVRIFLPTDISTDDFKGLWKGAKTKDVTVVPS